MPSPTKAKPNPPFCRPKAAWCVYLAITTVPFYLMTLFAIGRKTSSDGGTTIAPPSIAAASDRPLSANTPTHISLHGKISRRDSSSKRESYQSIAREIAAKWNLTSPEAPYLLEQQFYKINDYNPQTDFLYFNHIHKVSNM